MTGIVLINSRSGTVRQYGEKKLCSDLQDLFEKTGLTVSIRLIAPNELQEGARAATSEQPDFIAAAGGDGTIGTVAGSLAGSEIALGVLPLGTFNLLARDYGIPLNLQEAIDVIATGNTLSVDVGEVSGRPFVISSLLGLYTRFVLERDKVGYKAKTGKMLAMFSAFRRAIARFPLLRLQLQTSEKTIRLRTSFVCVGVGAFTLKGGFIGRADPGLNGTLTLAAARASHPWQTCKLILRELLNSPPDEREMLFFRDTSFTLDRHRGNRPLQVTLDGELFELSPPLHFTVRPAALRLLVPVETEPADLIQDTARAPSGTDAG